MRSTALGFMPLGNAKCFFEFVIFLKISRWLSEGRKQEDGWEGRSVRAAFVSMTVGHSPSWKGVDPTRSSYTRHPSAQ